MPTNILYLSSGDLSKAATLQARIEKLQGELASLIGTSQSARPAAAKKGRGAMSAEQRAKLSKAAKARWKKAKAAGKTTL